MGVNRQFQAKTAKYQIGNMSKTINRIMTKFDDQAAGRHLEKNGYDVITPPTIV